MSHPEAAQPPQTPQSPQPSGELVGSLSTPITRRHALELARNALVGLIFLPAALRGKFDHTPPTSPPPTETATSTVTPPSPPTVEPSPTATERAAIKEIELAPGSAVVDFPRDKNTPWEVADRFASGSAVSVDGTITDPGGRQYHRIRAADGRTGFVLQEENEIPPESQTPLAETVPGRNTILVHPDNPFVFKAGPEVEEGGMLPLGEVVEPDQDFTYFIAGSGFTPFTIGGSTVESPKIHVSPHADGGVSVRVEGKSQQSDDMPITLSGYEAGRFGVSLRVRRGDGADTLVVQSWGAVSAAREGTADPGGSIHIRGGFREKNHRGVVARGTNTDLTIDELRLERGLGPTGVTRDDLILEHHRGGSIHELTGQKIGTYLGSSGAESTFLQDHRAIQWAETSASPVDSRFFPKTRIHRGIDRERFTIQRLAEMGVETDFGIRLNTVGDKITTDDVRLDHEQVVAMLETVPTLPVALGFFDSRGGINIDPKLRSLYPGGGGGAAAAANAIAFYNGLNSDPGYEDPVTHERYPRSVNIQLSADMGGSGVRPTLDNLAAVRRARDVHIGAVTVYPENLSEVEVGALIAGLHGQGLRIRFSGVGLMEMGGGTPSPHTDTSLTLLCKRLGIPIDVMTIAPVNRNALHGRDGTIRYNTTNPDGSPVSGSPYDQYLSALK